MPDQPLTSSDEPEGNTAYAYLAVGGFTCTVAELTERIGLVPNESWSKGDVFGPKARQRRHDAWHMRSRLPETDAIERHIEDVLAQIEGYQPVFLEMSREPGLSIIMQCVGFWRKFNPGFSLDAQIIRRISECGAHLDLDFYHWWNDDEMVEEPTKN